MRAQTAFELNLGQPIGQCRACPVRLGDSEAILLAYGADFDVDPYVEMFFFPKDTLKLALVSLQGEVLWRHDLGPGVVPGMWFCPVAPCDLDGDGVDEIYFPASTDPQHPLAASKYALHRIDVRSRVVEEVAPFPQTAYHQPLSHRFRNFMIPCDDRLILGAGTYGPMTLRALGSGFEALWTHEIAADSLGARGSHMCPLMPLSDGSPALMWGERCIRVSDGAELWCGDRQSYRGHSDVIAPFLADDGRWRVWTIRESDPGVSPRVAVFDDSGKRMWGAIDAGHMDMGWVARLGGQQVATAIRIGAKACGPDGRFHSEIDEFAFDARTGRRMDLGYSTYRTLPVDFDGDGDHELVRGQPGGDGALFKGGREVAGLGGAVAMATKILDAPGEQILTYSEDGHVRLWFDAEAANARPERYDHDFYRWNRKLTATGFNLVNLGGL